MNYEQRFIKTELTNDITPFLEDSKTLEQFLQEKKRIVLLGTKVSI